MDYEAMFAKLFPSLVVNVSNGPEPPATPDEAYAAAYKAGGSFAAGMLGFMYGFADEVNKPGGGIEDVPEGMEYPHEDHSEPGECKRCWCNTCAKLDSCPHTFINATPEEVAEIKERCEAAGTPRPCMACAPGERHAPSEDAPPCGDEYEEAPGENYG